MEYCYGHEIGPERGMRTRGIPSRRWSTWALFARTRWRSLECSSHRNLLQVGSWQCTVAGAGSSISSSRQTWQMRTPDIIASFCANFHKKKKQPIKKKRTFALTRLESNSFWKEQRAIRKSRKHFPTAFHWGTPRVFWSILTYFAGKNPSFWVHFIRAAGARFRLCNNW